MFCISNKTINQIKLNNLIIKKNICFSNKSNLMNAGIYIVNKNIKIYKQKNFSLEDEIIPNLIENNKVQGKAIKAIRSILELIKILKNLNQFQKK